MVNLIITDRLRSACQLALETPGLPDSLRAQIEAAATPLSKMELKERERIALAPKAGDKSEEETIMDKVPGSDARLKDQTGMEAKVAANPAPVPLPLPRTISHKTAKELSTFLMNSVGKDMTEDQRAQYSLYHLLQQGGIYVEPPKPRVKSEALLKILNKITLEQQEQEYQRMKNTGTARAQFFGVELRETVTEFRRTGKWVSGIVNMLFSTVAIFFGGMIVGAQMSSDWGMRVLVGMGCAFIVLVAEFYFFFFYNLVPEVSDENEPAFDFMKKKPKKASSGPNQTALAKNRAAAEAFALQNTATKKQIES